MNKNFEKGLFNEKLENGFYKLTEPRMINGSGTERVVARYIESMWTIKY